MRRDRRDLGNKNSQNVECNVDTSGLKGGCWLVIFPWVEIREVGRHARAQSL